MTLEVRLRPEAEQDLSDAAVWYEEQLSGYETMLATATGTSFVGCACAPLASDSDLVRKRTLPLNYFQPTQSNVAPVSWYLLAVP